MRNRIWAELTQSKHNIEFATLYSDRQRYILRIFNIGILAFSSAGIMGWKVWEDIPLISCILIAGISLLRLLQPHLIMNEKQLKILMIFIDFMLITITKLKNCGMILNPKG